ncbi:MAG: FAD-dependent oxidoreductase [Candidatus Helarchaeota archaeon]
MARTQKITWTSVKPNRLAVADRINNFKEVNLGYTEDLMLTEASRCLQCTNPPCVASCPCHCDVKELIRLTINKKYDEALNIIFKTYCFPRSIDRVCPGFCQQGCTLGKKGEPVQIMLIKRFLADHIGLPKSYTVCAPKTGKKIAILGSGPAGLTAAYYLTKLGHEVTVFEKLPVLGGLMQVGIPEFRLPKKVLQTEIEQIKKLGVKFFPNTPIEKTCNFDGLFSQGFEAIFLGIGTHAPKWMGIPGEQLKGCIHALDFLKEYNLGQKNLTGVKIAIVGGGNSALDSARVALRLGADPFIVYRRHRDQMPANPSEILEAEEEGIPIHFLTNPIRILEKRDKIVGIECVRMQLGELDRSGRPRPIPIPNSNFIIAADMFIEAISQEPEVAPFKNTQLKFTQWNTFETCAGNCVTNVEGVFAGGDCINGTATIVKAVRDAHKAVGFIDAFLNSH